MLRAIFVGNGSLLIRCAEIYVRVGNVIAGVVTSERRIADWAQSAGVRLFDWPEGRNPDLGGIEFEYLFSIANLRLVPTAILAKATHCAVNFHDSLLPAYAGRNATSWALMAGETRHGVTWHEMTDEVDGGRLLRQQSFAITSDDTAFTVNAKCYEAAAASFAALIEDLQRGQVRFVARDGIRSYFGRYDRPDAAATADFAKRGNEIVALVRALDFGAYPNPLGRAKLFLGHDVLLVRSAAIAAAVPSGPPGRLVALDEDRIVVSCVDADICFTGLAAPDGSSARESLRRNGLNVGDALSLPSADLRTLVSLQNRDAARSEAWWSQEFARLAPITLPYPRRLHPGADESGALLSIVLDTSGGGSARPKAALERILAGFVAWAGRLTGAPCVSLLYSDGSLVEAAHGIEPWFKPGLPLTVEIPSRQPVDAHVARVAAAIDAIRHAGPYNRDLPFRVTEAASVTEALGRLCVGVELAAAERGMFGGCDMVLSVDPASGRAALNFPGGRFTLAVMRTIAAHLDWFLGEFLFGTAPALGDIPLIPLEESAAIERWNRTATKIPDTHGIADEIARQIRRSPNREALRWHDQSLDYAALDVRVGILAARLVANGAGRGTIVGIHLERTPELVVAVLATLSTGAAYLPLDPAYPSERLRLMVEDSGASIILTSGDLTGSISWGAAALILVDSPHPTSPPLAGEGMGWGSAVSPDDLAYVIYTSGSTGRPKGVMVTHRNLLNFFAGMDACIPHADGGRWLAVTSLSFDISVLELLWTLARGFVVVLHANPRRTGNRQSAQPAFSLFYFSSDAASADADKYRLLVEGAKFADREGFAAVWTPERHFHPFGGLYPNSAITSAALAMVTERVAIRAGSCVLPLHSPIRAAEDWALVDNLSGGRVGVSLASGWHPNDFVIAPGVFADRKDIMIAGVDTLRRLWRGEALSVRNPNGEMVSVRTLPRPVQSEIPLWLTAAGNPETFRQAGEIGCGVLTHLIGQSLEDLAEKIGVYRVAWLRGGHADKGHVTLMLHAFIGDTDEFVHETVYRPMKEYLRSSVDLIRRAAWSFPTFAQRAAANGQQESDPFDVEAMSEAEMDVLLDHAFERYYATSGLFGTVESCRGIIGRLIEIGVDEIACLIDFGVPTERVLESLPRLKRLMDRATQDCSAVYRASVAEDVAAHRITHLQCTPSMASMLVADAPGRSALSSLEVLMVGGEALPVSLARELRALVPGKLLNMYGPTEATIWSSVCDLEEIGDFVPLGTPIANTSLRVLDKEGRECPALIAGELHIGGAGVARGYCHRPELTAERFVRDPLAADDLLARLYRTGDLVRRHPDGALEYIGRTDYQVKVRGHRVELGEIETLLASEPAVREAVVIARQEAAGGTQLLAYVTLQAHAAPDGNALQQRLGEKLPEFMVPARVTVLPAMPITPNGKIDRAALPLSDPIGERPAAPEGETEALLATIWCELLGLREVSPTANFFDIGGHSLMVVQVQRRLQAATGREIALVDMYRHPTIRALAAEIDGKTPAASAVGRGVDRAQARRAMLRRRW
jgi:natural product biosynthesis luciferase-like monooxygenase protein